MNEFFRLKHFRRDGFCDKSKLKQANESHRVSSITSIPLSVFRSALLSSFPLHVLVKLLNHCFKNKHELILLLQSDWSINSQRLLRSLLPPETHCSLNPPQELYSNIDHDCVTIRLSTVKQLGNQQHVHDFKVFQLLCGSGLLDGDHEVRMFSVRSLIGFTEFAGQALSTLNRRDNSTPISGMLICALEDEYMQIRCDTLKIMEAFALSNSEFAQASIDHMADMLNDEIEEVRIQAIHSIRALLLSNRSTSDTLDMMDFVGLLSSLEDGSSTVRSAFRGVLEVIIIDSAQTLRSILNEGLLKNLKRYPEDKEQIWECAAKLGRNHEHLVVLLHGELLGANAFLTISEPDIEDTFYLTLLVFLLNGLFCTDKNWQSPYNIPFLNKHIQAIRIINRNLLPEPIRFLIKDDVCKENIVSQCDQILNETIQLCNIADECRCSQRLENCVQMLDAFENTHLQDAASFYRAQVELRSAVYSKYFNLKYFTEMSFRILSGFEDVEGIPDLSTLVQKVLANSKDLPSFIVLPKGHSVLERKISSIELNHDVYKVAAGLILPVNIRAQLRFRKPFDLYAQIYMPNGRVQMHYIPNKYFQLIDELSSAEFSTIQVNCQIFISSKRAWTSAAIVQIRLGYLLDAKFLSFFNISQKSPAKCRNLRFVPLSDLITFKMHPLNVMF